jgi:hypothetical protein
MTHRDGDVFDVCVRPVEADRWWWAASHRVFGPVIWVIAALALCDVFLQVDGDPQYIDLAIAGLAAGLGVVWYVQGRALDRLAAAQHQLTRGTYEAVARDRAVVTIGPPADPEMTAGIRVEYPER